MTPYEEQMNYFIENDENYHQIEDIKNDAKNQIEWGANKMSSEIEIYETSEGDFVKSVYLGTVFGIFPSGKYYMPWACSNLELCPMCHGSEVVKEDNGKLISCPFCGGMGSREAYEDEIFRETLEEEAEKHGCRVESGEGDPCDILLIMDVSSEYVARDEEDDCYE